MAAEDGRDVITVRLQSTDRKASQEFSIHRVCSPSSSSLHPPHPPHPTRHPVCVLGRATGLRLLSVSVPGVQQLRGHGVLLFRRPAGDAQSDGG